VKFYNIYIEGIIYCCIYNIRDENGKWSTLDNSSNTNGLNSMQVRTL
jgi:hypothetical protein